MLNKIHYGCAFSITIVRLATVLANAVRAAANKVSSAPKLPIAAFTIVGISAITAAGFGVVGAGVVAAGAAAEA